MSSNYTICESFTLPSKGLMYKRAFDPKFTLRSMTTAEEMKRLAPSESPYKVMCEIIEDCLTEKLKVPVYDLCLGDYQYMLHKLRIVTYGSDYKIAVRCPVCGCIEEINYNLDEMEVFEYTDDIQNLLKIHLPQTKKDIELRLQTPRILDDINSRKKELLKKSNNVLYDPSFMLTLTSLIKTVDGEELNPAALENFITHLPMRDANILIQTADQLNRKVGLNTNITCTCNQCHHDIKTTFRITSEFFGPSVY